MNILAYGCSTAAGRGVEPFWRGLLAGTDHSQIVSLGKTQIKYCGFQRDHFESYCQFLSEKLLESFKSLYCHLSSADVGVIFASTKGCIDDFVWSNDRVEHDPYMPVLKEFLKKAELEDAYHIVMSNACASSLSAFYLAKNWLDSKRFKYVLVLAGDMIGPFVAQGFQVLKVSAPEGCRPFDKNRQGTQLGDAACSILLSNEPGLFQIENVQIDTEGFAVTRPTQSGLSLRTVVGNVSPPDLIIAHATGTLANDEVEAHVFSEIFPEVKITGTKWSVGHALGASGALDTIAACEAIKHQKIFGLANTKSSLPGNFVLQNSDTVLKRVLITSLGFGGVHAAAVVRSND